MTGRAVGALGMIGWIVRARLDDLVHHVSRNDIVPQERTAWLIWSGCCFWYGQRTVRTVHADAESDGE